MLYRVMLGIWPVGREVFRGTQEECITFARTHNLKLYWIGTVV